VIEFAAVFWIGIIITGIIGLLRGWVREVQVTASAILAMFIIDKFGGWVFDTVVARTTPEMLATDPMGTFRRIVMLKLAVLLILVFFGYQGPVLVTFATQQRVQANRARETIQEGLLGLIVGLLNGYLILGAIWWYLHLAQYPFDFMVSPVAFFAGQESASVQLIEMLPLAYLASPWLDILVVVAFIIVIVIVL
jgi:hypothetical protein